MRSYRSLLIAALVFMAAACLGGDSARPGDSALSAAPEDTPAVMRGVEGIPGWTRIGPPELFNKKGLYGYIDGGAEIVLQYGFRELAVSKFRPAAAAESGNEIVLEIYRMSSGEAAFGLYSTKLEGGEKGCTGIKPDSWLSPGQASLVKGEFFVNVLAPACTEKEIGEFLGAVEPKIPGRGTARPKGLGWLPLEGMVPSSWRYVKGPLAAQNESPFLAGDFWGFAPGAGGQEATVAYSAKYGAGPVISKLIVVKLGTASASPSFEEGVAAAFGEYLKDVRREGTSIEGRNDAGRWFLFKRAGSIAGLVLGEPDEAAAPARLDEALKLATGQKSSQSI